MNDPYDLQRFIDAQKNVYHQVQEELAMGSKETHWMWFIFPQIDGLGSSAVAKRFAIKSIAEAEAYVDHPLLGHRLRESTERVLRVSNRSINQIFGFPDDRKFQSSMTLFAKTSMQNGLFLRALEKYFSSEMDMHTLERL